MTRDLTTGSPMKLIVGFGLPTLLGYLFQQFYNVVDTAIVGKTLGGAALAAVGSTGAINFLVVGFCMGICGGFAIPVAQQFGAGEPGELRKYVAGGTVLTAFFAVALTAASKVSMFLCCPFDAMGATMATYGGQNVGAGKWERLHQGLKACTLLGAIYSALAFAVVFALSGPLNMLFLDRASMDLLPLARRYLLTLAAFYFPLALVNIVRFLIQGMGFSPLATVAGVLEMVARAGVSCLVGTFGFSAACFASPAAWIMADLFLIPAYFHCRRKLTVRYGPGAPAGT